MAAPPPSPPSPATPSTHVTAKFEFVSSNLSKEKSPKEPSPASISVPSHSRWFAFGEIHVTEIRMLPEFFDGKTTSKNPNLYKYYRDSIIRRFRENPLRRISFTEVRRTLIGDVGSIRRVFDFLETWGLINYTGSRDIKPALDEKDKKGSDYGVSGVKSICSSCKSECNIVCFATEKVPDLILCARCFVRGGSRGGLTHADFKKIDVGGISEDKKRDWSDKDVLHLLEALLLYGDEWKKVAEHVGGGKSEKDCIMRFVRLPFAEQFMDQRHPDDDNSMKNLSLSPLADASNPIMSQVAFLAAIAGSDIVEAASKAALGALEDGSLDNSHLENIGDFGTVEGNEDEDGIFPSSKQQESKDLRRAIAEAKILIKKEEQDLEESLSQIVGTQMKGMVEKIVHFEELELLLEREWLQMQHLRNLLFADQLNFLQQRSRSKLEDGADKMTVEASGKE